ncbi:MAG: alpha/beta hydrolase [Aphanocapsa sp. GSE-SYN-MK-11-07L]|jgi:proline iminopeptidase|nr:alpha/beta hydrolase [Aphanocapsa sp. GSE-SYN-MK-11-07L]
MQLFAHTAGAGFPILCLHGHPGSGACFEVLTQHLAQRFFTLAPDLRGYGQSRAQGEFAMLTHLDDLENLLDQYQIDRCLVIGWSLGGILGLELALRLPARINGLVLIATAARPSGDHPPISWQDNLYTGIASLLNWVRPGWQWNIDAFGRRSLYRYLVQRHTPQTYRYLATYALPAYLQTSKAAERALFTAIRQGYNRLPNLAQIQCPCLVMAGEQDRHINATASRATAEHLAKSTWICYPNTAHLFPWEIPQQVLIDIDQWLNLHPQAKSNIGALE